MSNKDQYNKVVVYKSSKGGISGFFNKLLNKTIPEEPASASVSEEPSVPMVESILEPESAEPIPVAEIKSTLEPEPEILTEPKVEPVPPPAAESEFQRRLAEKQAAYDAMVSSMDIYPIHVSEKPAPKLAIAILDDITYSNITKKTPRDKLGDFVVIDTETTGLKPSSDEIIDIAAIRFRNYIPVCKFSMLLSPKKALSAEAAAINGITEDMVAGQPTFQQIAESLVEFIGSDNLVGHNLPFDLKFITKYGADVTAQKRKYYDTLEIAQKTVKKVKMKWDKELEDYYPDYDSDGIENHKLGTLCDWYGILNPESHRAESDALAAGFLLKKLADDRA